MSGKAFPPSFPAPALDGTAVAVTGFSFPRSAAHVRLACGRPATAVGSARGGGKDSDVYLLRRDGGAPAGSGTDVNMEEERMWHNHRAWKISVVTDPETLARILTERIWATYAGFLVEGHENYLFLNDSTGAAGFQEYGVVLRAQGKLVRQIDSITFSWCTENRALQYLREILAGEWDERRFCEDVDLCIEEPATLSSFYCA
ncbi:MAG: hypothetical protein D6773_02070 [Alphaproteobacteria bacterium]|nr:MAG: hypothetical protein D6773_02070 [Alphaproteobacteria bacterium]